MTIAELIQELSQYPDDWTVFVDASDGDFREIAKVWRAIARGNPARSLDAIAIEFDD